MVEHKHRFAAISFTGSMKTLKAIESCACGEKRERKATKDEITRIDADWKRAELVNHLWLPVLKQIEYWDPGWKCPKCKLIHSGTPKKIKACAVCKTPVSKMTWDVGKEGLRGWDFIEWMEKYRKKHPEIEKTIWVDDNYHCNSAVYLIPHFCDHLKWGSEWMGLTVLFVPQCTGERPTTMFLYPRAHKELVTALNKTLKISRKYKHY